MRSIYPTLTICLLICTLTWSDEVLFSGPQVGEPLAPFAAQAGSGENAGEQISVLDDERDSPMLLVFVHQVTRPSIGLVRLLMNYADAKKKEGLASRLVFLSDDPTETEAWLRRARKALPKSVTPLISLAGIEGPGAYGLHRKMTLTVLVAKDGKVTANFPLVQPSVQADAAKIGHAIIKVLGGAKAPTLKEMGWKDRRMNMRKRAPNPDHEGVYRRMIAPVIQKNATAKEVTLAAKKLEAFADENEWFKQRVHKAAMRILASGKLPNYGTPEAQSYLKKWAQEFSPASKAADDKPEKRNAPAKSSTDSTRGLSSEKADSE